MARRLSPDYTLLAITVALMGFGMVMVWSASSVLAQDRHGSPYYFLVKQALWGVIGIGGMVAALRVDYRLLRRPGVVYGLLAASTLLLIVVLFLRPVNETHRWIRLGALSFQPAELAKLSIIVFLAYHIERRLERVNDFTLLFPALLLLGWFGFLILIQPDLGTAFCLVLTGAVMLFVAGVRLRYFLVLAIPCLTVLYAAIVSTPWRSRRLTTFFDPWSDPQGAGYQVIQSLIAVGTGGISGVGIGEGRQKLFFLPYPYSDFIFAVIGEEVGMLGALAVVLAFVVILWRGLRAAWGAPDVLGRFIAGGITLSIVFQALINVSVTLGLLPTKGIPLPFISAGGSSLVFALVGIGLVANVSQHAD
jgi:cell division protein FtsW